MKKILFAVLTVLLLFVSCDKPDQEPLPIEVEGSFDVENLSAGDSVTLIVDSDDVINFPECSVADNYSITIFDGKKGSSNPTTPSDSIVETALGKKLVTPHSDPNQNKVTGEDLGVSSDKVTIKVTHIKSDNDLVITTSEIEQIGKTTRGKTNSRGYYQDLPIEEHYHIPANKLQKLENIHEVAIFQQFINMGGDKYDYGFIKKDKINLISNNNDIYGLVDLGEETGEISLFNSIRADTRQNSLLRLCIESPTVLTSTDQPILEENSFSGKAFVYKIEKSSAEAESHYVVEITRNQDIGAEDYEIFNGYGLGDSRYIGTENNGKRRKQMLTPIKNANGKLVFYVGEIEEDFIFNLVIDKDDIENYGSIKLRKMDADDCSSFAILTNTSTTDIQINGLSCSYKEGNSVKLTLSPENGVIGFIIKNTSNTNLTFNGTYSSSGASPALHLYKRGTSEYYCNGTGSSSITANFNSNTVLGYPHEGVQKRDTIIVYLTYANADETTPVGITLSFGEPYQR